QRVASVGWQTTGHPVRIDSRPPPLSPPHGHNPTHHRASSSSSSAPPPRPQPRSFLKQLPGLAATAAAAAVASVPLPALAVEMEKAALFDFNLTLPAITIEFLLLMVALDKLYFSPLGKFMDERDAKIRAELGGVKDASEEVRQLEEQAQAILKAARAEIAAALNKMKKETTTELEAKLDEGRRRVEAELVEALASLEGQKEEAIKALDAQIVSLSDEIVKKVLPSA
uniref:ATP synthase subunit b', chloroplastic n=4 Tax=Triticinae TaxID=1648030 RepID=A0A453ID11_AEGTS